MSEKNIFTIRKIASWASAILLLTLVGHRSLNAMEGNKVEEEEIIVHYNPPSLYNACWDKLGISLSSLA